MIQYRVSKTDIGSNPIHFKIILDIKKELYLNLNKKLRGINDLVYSTVDRDGINSNETYCDEYNYIEKIRR